MAAMGTGAALPLSDNDMRLARESIKLEFRNLADTFQVTSWPNQNYNCIAWAADDFTRWWWPDPDGEAFWPSGVPRREHLDAFIAAFETLGYEVCPALEIEPEYEKVAIYAVGTSPKHMARQLPSGTWTSKLGPWWDISHELLQDVEAPLYGRSTTILRRKRRDVVVIPSHT